GWFRTIFQQLLGCKDLVSCLLRMQSSVVHDGTHLLFGASVRERAKLFFSALVITGETEQFKQECPLVYIGRVVAEIGSQLPLRFAHPACVEKFPCSHRVFVPCSPL